MEKVKVYVVGVLPENQDNVMTELASGNYPLLGAPVEFSKLDADTFELPMFRLGQKVCDRVTGFTGIVTAHIRHITGCDTYALQPPVNKDGVVPEARSFDQTRLVLVDDGILSDNYALPANKSNGGSSVPLDTDESNIIS